MTAVASPVSSVGSVHINRPLTQFSLGYHPDEDGYIAEKIFPSIKVTNESDEYFEWDRTQAFRVQQSDGYGTLVADGAAAPIRKYGFTQKLYHARAYKAATFITDRERNNADPGLNLQYSTTRRVQAEIMLDQEIRVANLLTSTANYASTNFHTYSGASQWNNASFVSQSGSVASTIKKNLDDGAEAIRQQTGLKPNTIIIPEAVRRVMSRDLGLIDELKYTHNNLLEGDRGDIIGRTLFGMDVLNPQGIFTDSVEGEAFSSTDIWGKCVILAYVSKTPALDAPSTGYIFRNRPWMVRSWREDPTEKTFYEASIIQDEKMTSNVTAYLLNAVIA